MRFLLLIALLLLAFSLAATEQGQSMSRETYEVLVQAQELLHGEQYGKARKLLAQAALKSDCCDPELAILLQTQAYVELGAGDYRAAAGFLQDALALDALPAKVAHPLRFTLAQLYAQQERYRDAAGLLKRWFADEPRPDAEAHLLAAQVYGRLKRFDQAIRHARKALALGSPPPEEHYRLLLGLYLQAGRWKGAARLLEEEILIRYPQRLEQWRQLAAVRMQLGQEEQAAAALELAHRKGLLEAKDIQGLARLYLHLGAPLKAAQLMEEAIKPTTANLRLLADAWQLAREPERAVRVLERVGQARDLVRAGELLLELERWPEAAQRLRQALNKGGLKQTARVHLLLGTTLLRQKDREGARQAFEAAAMAEESEKIREQAQRWLVFLDSGE